MTYFNFSNRGVTVVLRVKVLRHLEDLVTTVLFQNLYKCKVYSHVVHAEKHVYIPNLPNYGDDKSSLSNFRD